jgi:poly-gamma-glutamate capsule biosynthesis protein CapA/YwtB (metallophosphatase superfamily)
MRHKTYRLQKSGSLKKKRLFIMFVLLIILIMVGSLWLIMLNQRKLTHNSSSSPSSNIKYLSVNGKYLFSGTIMLGRAVEKYANGDYNQPFSGMSTLGKYDAAIGVLECPVTNNVVSYQTQVNSLIFNCQPQWLPTLKKYFPIINLSSNHLYDQGEDGYNETVERLSNAGFQTVGNYNPHIEKDDCKTVVLPVHLQKSSGQEDNSFLPVAFCSFNYKTLFKPEPGELESIQKWSKLMPVIALMNGGPEYQHQAGADQINVAHKMIDYGADFVVGNGTHWVQNTEVYKGKLIVYSMGNFIFDQLDYDGRIALNLSVGMTLHYDDNISKWLKIGDNCKYNTSNCMLLAKTQGLIKISPSFKFDVIGSYGGFQQVATLANNQQQKDIEQRANWPVTQQLLAQ